MARRLFPWPGSWVRGSQLVGLALALLAAGGFLGWRWYQHQSERQQGLQLAQHDRFADAEPRLKRVLERAPNDVAVLKALALGKLAVEPAEAEVYASRWCALQPDSAEPYRLRMIIWARLKRLPQAVTDGQRLLEMEPGNDPLRLQVAQWLWSIGQPDKAEHECHHCLQRHPGHPDLLYLLGKIHWERGELSQAASLVDDILSRHPDLPPVLELRGLLHYGADQWDQAVALLRKARARDRNPRPLTLYYLSLALARLGQTEEAEQLLAEVQLRRDLELWAKSNQAETPGMQVRLAESLFGAGQTEEALRLLRKVLDQDPEQAAAHQLLASYYEKLGQTAQAQQHRRRVPK